MKPPAPARVVHMRFLLPALLAAAAVNAVAAVRQPAGSAAEVAAALQRKYDTIRDFSADFVHEAESSVLRKKLTERGTVLVKKPGRMRWDYKTPEQKLFVSDGANAYMYVPADNQVVITPIATGDQATTAVLFLTGRGNLTRDFNVSFAQNGGAADTWALRLDPRTEERDYDWLEIVVDRSSFRLRSLKAAEKQGTTSTFRFSNFKENVGLADKTFAFTIPRGADVIRSGSSSR
jgi:outer membrane lipoprotein carrier protein